jgi:hypothetical protein
VDLVSDAEIELAIQRGIDALASQFDPKSHRLRSQRGNRVDAMQTGLHALCTYALIQGGLAVNDPRLARASPAVRGLLEALKKMPADTGRHQTYARGLRATALSVFNRKEDQQKLAEDVACLIAGQYDGAYGYLSATPYSVAPFGQLPPVDFKGPGTAGRGGPWLDNSNSQYGLLGVWSAAETGLKIPPEYWKLVEAHWRTTQLTDGSWSYQWPGQVGKRAESWVGKGSLSMTSAGIASTYVASEYTMLSEGDGVPKVGRDPFPEPVHRALLGLEQGDLSVNIPSQPWWGYNLYGIERVGLASGLKYLGTHDWYRELARKVINQQMANGSWKNHLIDTAFAVLFLSRGRHPVLVNKLRLDRLDHVQPDHWHNRPRDAAFLTRYASQQLERPLNWQIVPLSRGFTDWMDCPVLYIASHRKPLLHPNDYENLRLFAHWGGLIFTQTDSDDPPPGTGGVRPPVGPGGTLAPPDPYLQQHRRPGEAAADADAAREFDQFVAALAAKLFPGHKFEDLPADHPIYSSLYRLSPGPKLKGVSNGSRLLLVHSPRDVARAWQKRDEKTGKAEFELGVNLFVYAAGKRDLRYRLDSPYVPPPNTVKADPVVAKVALLQYPGNASPEPEAWTRFSRVMQWDTGTRVDPVPIRWKDLKPDPAAHSVAHVTGTAGYAPTGEEVGALKAYVEAGGVLLVDNCGGSGAFAESLRATLKAAFPSVPLRAMPPEHPLLDSMPHGMSAVSKPRLRIYAAEQLRAEAKAAGTTTQPSPSRRDGTFEYLAAGKGHVVFTTLDLTTGLVGANTWGVIGYEPSYAQSFVQNVVFWTIDGQHDQ